MSRVLRATETGTALETGARETRDRMAAMASVVGQFSDFRPQAEVIHNVEAVPTILPWYDHVTGVGGHPISRFTLVHGPSNEGKSLFTMAMIASFLRRFHFAGLVDAERTMTSAWVRQMIGDELADHPGFAALPVGSYEQVRAGVRNYCETIAKARQKGTVPDATSGVIVVDSIRKLVPKKLWDELAKATSADKDEAKPKCGKFGRKKEAGIDGMGGRAGQIKAALNAAWVDELIPLLADTRMAMIVIARETEDADADKWSGKTWKIGGGSALYYEASLDIRITRNWLRVGDAILGEKHHLAIWKTKISGKTEKVPEAWFHTSNDTTGHPGFDLPRDLITMGIDIGALTQDGAWVKLGKRSLGQGVDAVVEKLHRTPALLQEIECVVRGLSEKSRVTSTTI